MKRPLKILLVIVAMLAIASTASAQNLTQRLGAVQQRASANCKINNEQCRTLFSNIFAQLLGLPTSGYTAGIKLPKLFPIALCDHDDTAESTGGNAHAGSATGSSGSSSGSSSSGSSGGGAVGGSHSTGSSAGSHSTGSSAAHNYFSNAKGGNKGGNKGGGSGSSSGSSNRGGSGGFNRGGSGGSNRGGSNRGGSGGSGGGTFIPLVGGEQQWDPAYTENGSLALVVEPGETYRSAPPKVKDDFLPMIDYIETHFYNMGAELFGYEPREYANRDSYPDFIPLVSWSEMNYRVVYNEFGIVPLIVEPGGKYYKTPPKQNANAKRVSRASQYVGNVYLGGDKVRDDFLPLLDYLETYFYNSVADLFGQERRPYRDRDSYPDFIPLVSESEMNFNVVYNEYGIVPLVIEPGKTYYKTPPVQR
jgi:type II secretory pathway pseudopilin PulG